MNQTISGFIKKEFAQTLRDPRMRVFLFVAPVVQLLVLGYAVSNEIKHVNLAFHYAAQDQLAKQLENHCRQTESFKVIDGFGHQPVDLIQSGRADAVVVIPPAGLNQAIIAPNGRVQLLIDGTNVLRARSTEQYLKAIIQKTMTDAFPTAISPPPVRFRIRVLYNPGMNTSYFLVPGVMSLLLCLLTVIMTSMSIVRERELGTFETLISAPVSRVEILLGKTIPFLIIGVVQVGLIMAAALFLFGLPMLGPWWQFILASLVYLCTTIAIGIFISTITRNQQQAMMGSFVFLFPGILLSGLMFPIENMPKLLMVAAYLNPIKYFLTLLRNIMLKGGDTFVFWTNLGVLVLMAVVMMSLALNRFRQNLN